MDRGKSSLVRLQLAVTLLLCLLYLYTSGRCWLFNLADLRTLPSLQHRLPDILVIKLNVSKVF